MLQRDSRAVARGTDECEWA